MPVQRIKWKSAAAVTNSHLRDSYPKWISDFLKCEQLIEERFQLERGRGEVKAAPRALPDVKKSFLNSLKNFVEFNQVQSLKAFINNYARHPDPANELRGELPDSPLRVFALWPDDIIDKAFSELEETWPANAITDAERKKRLAGIDRDIKKIDTDLKKFPDFQAWQAFVEDWRALNSKVSEGCDPQGIDLRANDRPNEKEAFSRLGIGNFNDPKSNFLPAAAN